MSIALKTEGLTKKFGNFIAVNSISLSVNFKDVYGLIGANGAGKTTFMQMIVGLLQPTSGKILLNGHDLELSPEYAKQYIGYVPDTPYLYNRLTGKEHLDLIATLWNVDNNKKKDIIDNLLSFFSLEAFADNYVETYSHGMKKKLGIASALVHQPKLLVLDEPFSGLDVKSRTEMLEKIKKYAADDNTVLISSHSITDVIHKVCNRIGIIDHGTLIADNYVTDLLKVGEKKFGKNYSLEDIFIKKILGEL